MTTKWERGLKYPKFWPRGLWMTPCALLHTIYPALNSDGAKRSALIFSNQHNSMSPHSGDATREQFLNGRYLTTSLIRSLFSLWKKNTRQVKIRSQFIFEIGKSFQKINEIDARPPQKRRNLKNVIIYPLCNCDCSDRPINKVVLGTPTNLCWWDEFSRLVSGEIGTFLTIKADFFSMQKLL